MTHIVVNPDDLLDVSHKLDQARADLEDVYDHLGRSVRNLDWEVRRATDIEGGIQDARHHLQTLADDLEQLVHFLREKAEAFREADENSARSLQGKSFTAHNNVTRTPPPPDISKGILGPHKSSWDTIRASGKDSPLPWVKRVMQSATGEAKTTVSNRIPASSTTGNATLSESNDQAQGIRTDNLSNAGTAAVVGGAATGILGGGLMAGVAALGGLGEGMTAPAAGGVVGAAGARQDVPLEVVDRNGRSTIRPVDRQALEAEYAKKRWSDVFAREETLPREIASLEQRESDLIDEKAALQRQIHDYDTQQEALLERRAQLEAERNQLLNKVLPSWPPRPGFDDGAIDAPWRTRADEIEDEIGKIDQQLSMLDQQRQIAATKLADVNHSLAQTRNQLRTARTEYDVIQQRIGRGVPADGPTRKDLITSKNYGLAGCTNYVAKKRDVTDFPNLGNGKPGHPMDAHLWDDQARRAGYEVGTQPVKGSIMVFEKGTLGVDRGAGHVAYVEKVERRGGGFVVQTSEAGTVRQHGHAVRGTHTPPRTETYYFEKNPDGGYTVRRMRHGKPVGDPVRITKPGESISFIYDKRE